MSSIAVCPVTRLLRYTSLVSVSDQMGFSFRPPDRRVWKVRDLVASVRSHIEREYSDAWVEGEISNFRAPIPAIFISP